MSLRAIPLLLLLTLPLASTGRCLPCCPLSATNLSLSEGAITASSSRSRTDAPCAVSIFTRLRMHDELAGRWLLFIGDSSTRGLVLALYYELLDAKTALAEAIVGGVVDNSTSCTRRRCRPQEEWAERSQRLFRYG